MVVHRMKKQKYLGDKILCNGECSKDKYPIKVFPNQCRENDIVSVIYVF